MPTYTYQCRQCQFEFNVEQAMTEDKKLACPSCGGLTQRKAMAAAIISKGKHATEEEGEQGHTHDEDCEHHSHLSGVDCAMAVDYDDLVKELQGKNQTTAPAETRDNTD